MLTAESCFKLSDDGQSDQGDPDVATKAQRVIELVDGQSARTAHGGCEAPEGRSGALAVHV